MGNPTLSLESYAPDVVEEETEEDLEDEINREEEDCNSIGGLREEGLSSLHVLLASLSCRFPSLVWETEMKSAKELMFTKPGLQCLHRVYRIHKQLCQSTWAGINLLDHLTE